MWTYLINANQPRIFAGRNSIDSNSSRRSSLSVQPEVKLQIAENEKPKSDESLPDWKRRMIEKNEAAKKEVIDIMDKSLKSVLAKNEMKPENQKAKAADSYVSAVDWIMWSVNSVVKRVK